MTSSAMYHLIHSLYQTNKKFPSIDELHRCTNCNKKDIQNVLNYFVENGRLLHVNGQYLFPNETKKKRVMFNLCRIIMAVVAVSCILCSIRFTYSFNKLTMPKTWGFILSSSMIIFTSFCFTVREYLLQQNKKKQATLFIALYVMGVTYSIFTAVAGQYNDYLIQNKTTVQAQLDNAVNEKKMQVLQEQKNNCVAQLNSYKEQIKAQQKIIDNLSESPERKWEYNNTWKQAVASVNSYNERIEILQNKINEVDLQIVENVTVENNSDENIYDWLGKLFNISSSLIQFLISLFPAIFIDLVSPFAISFAFIDKNK